MTLYNGAGLVSAGPVTIQSATGLVTNQSSFALLNGTATTVNFAGAATTLNIGSAAGSAIFNGNLYSYGNIGNNTGNISVRAQGTWNNLTISGVAGGYNSPPYTNQSLTGGSGTGMTATYSSVGGYVSTVTMTNAGSGYKNGDVLTLPGGAGSTVILSNYNPNYGGQGVANWLFSMDGNIALPVYANINSNGVNILSTINGSSSITVTGNVTGANVVATHYGNAIGTTATYSGNVTANYFIGNGSALTGISANSYGNIYGTTSNVTLQAGNYNYTFDTTGNLTMPTNGDIILPGTNANLQVGGSVGINGITTLTYSGSSGSVLQINGADTKGGAGYHDFLSVTNTGASATGNKYFRLNSTGSLQIVNSGYTTTLMTLTDTGDMTIAGNVTQSGIQPGYSANRPAFRVVGLNSTGYTSSSPTGGVLTSSQFSVDYNQGSYLNTSTGVFTAPVAGLYQVCFTGRTNSNSNSNASGFAVQKNAGTNVAYIEWAPNTTANHLGASTILKLAVGDTLKLVVTAGTVNFDGNNNWSVAYIG